MLPFDIYTLVSLQKSIAFAAMALLVVAAYSDLRSFRVPNVLVLAIAALGIGRLVVLGDLLSIFYAAFAVVLIFVIGFVLFSRGLVGGGDVKLLMASMLLIRYRDFYQFFVLIGIFGALLSLVVIMRNNVPLFAGTRTTTSRSVVPYGVAIAAAGIMTLIFQPLLFRYSIPSGLSFLW